MRTPAVLLVIATLVSASCTSEAPDAQGPSPTASSATAPPPSAPAPGRTTTGSTAPPSPEAATGRPVLRAAASGNTDPRRLVDGDCRTSFAVRGYPDVACNLVQLAGGEIYWVVNADTASADYLVQVRTPSGDESWTVTLQGSRRGRWKLVDGLDGPFSGTGERVLLMAYRDGPGGRDGDLAYDVVTWTTGSPAPLVSLHRERLIQGSIRPSEDGIDEYAADLSDGSPPCCPKRFRHARYSGGGRGWRSSAPRTVPTSEVPRSAV